MEKKIKKILTYCEIELVCRYIFKLIVCILYIIDISKKEEGLDY